MGGGEDWVIGNGQARDLEAADASGEALHGAVGAGAALDVARVELQPHAPGGLLGEHGAFCAGVEHHGDGGTVHLGRDHRGALGDAERYLRPGLQAAGRAAR